MKTLGILGMAMVSLFLGACIVEAADSDKANIIKPGMYMADIRTVLSTHNIKQVQRYLDVAATPGKEVAYFSLDYNVYLHIGYEVETRKVICIGLNFIPSHVTEKGQDVWKEVSAITFDSRGNYTVQFIKSLPPAISK